MSLLQGNRALVIGFVGLVATLLLRAVARDPILRRDVGGAIGWFVLFLGLRVGGLWLPDVTPADWHPYLRVTWMLSFAFALIRTAVAVALWGWRRISPRPTAKILRDVLDFVLYVVAAIPILKTQLQIDVTTLLGTSAVLSLVLGFALQDTLGNLFSGLSLQLERPFEVGDWVQVGEKVGRVVQVAWRATRLETVRQETVTLPNSLIGKEKVINFTRGGLPVGIDLKVDAAYEAPPSRVKAEVLEALHEIPLILPKPQPAVRLSELGDSKMTYLARFYIQDYGALTTATDEVLSRVWYRFGRAGIEIPFPQTVVTMREAARPRTGPGDLLLSQLDLFSVFSSEERKNIASLARERHFGAGEAVVQEGREGDTFYVVVTGTLSVRVGKPGTEVAKLGRGQGFGEMSLLTGEKRVASVIALEDCQLLEFDREAFAQNFERHPEHAQQLAQLLSERRAGLAAATALEEAPRAAEEGRILERLRSIFRLRG